MHIWYVISKVCWSQSVFYYFTQSKRLNQTKVDHVIIYQLLILSGSILGPDKGKLNSEWIY